ncbi:phosphoenolpyruvate carboxylase [Acinetobacter baumannii]
MLPAWLGTGAAINEVIADQQKATLDEMLQQWPYFQTLDCNAAGNGIV